MKEKTEITKEVIIEKWNNLGFFYKEPYYKKARELMRQDYPVGTASVDDIAKGIFIYEFENSV